jgi:LysR family glycine cleavage system transcriptional activator
MLDLPPLTQLRAFEAAARHLSFLKAAAELGVTPTAISHQIRLLEQYCGEALFRRRPRPLTLTEAGASLFPVVRDGLAGFATAIASVRRGTDRRLLRVSTTNAFAGRWLVPRLPGWRRLHPETPLDVIGTDTVLDLAAGDADVAIRYARTVPADGIVEEIARDNYLAMCSPSLAATGLTRPADLARQVLVHCYWSPADAAAPTWSNWLAAARRRWRNVPDLGQLEHLSFREELHAIEAVMAGQGIGIFSDMLLAPELAAGKLVCPLPLPLPGYGYYVVRRPGHPRERTIRAFAAWLKSAT